MAVPTPIVPRIGTDTPSARGLSGGQGAPAGLECGTRRDWRGTGFFRALISGYLDKDPAVIDFIQRVKEERNFQSIKKRKNSKKLLEAGEETKSKFSIFKDGEVENIFDIIEKEFPDL